MPRETAALLVVSGKGRDSWLLSALLSAVLDTAEQEVHVEWAPTLEKAVERLTARSWQACLVDEQVGDETGLEIVRQARARGIAVPMVLCMSHDDKTLQDIALEEGAAEVLPLSTASPKRLGKVLHAAMVRGRAENKVRSSGDRYAKIFEESPVAMTITTLEDGRFLDANPAFCRLLGYARSDVVGHTSQELGLWTEERGRNALRARLRQTGAVEGVETLIQDREGRLIHVLTTSRVVRIDDRPCVLGITTDITGSRRAETEIQRREAQLEVAEAAAGRGSWDYDIPTSTLRCSAHLGRMLGLQDEARTVEGYLSKVLPEDRERVAEAFRKATQRGAPLKVRHRVRLPEGGVMELEMEGTPEFDYQDEAIGIFGTVGPAPHAKTRRSRSHEEPPGPLPEPMAKKVK